MKRMMFLFAALSLALGVSAQDILHIHPRGHEAPYAPAVARPDTAAIPVIVEGDDEEEDTTDSDVSQSHGYDDIHNFSNYNYGYDDSDDYTSHRANKFADLVSVLLGSTSRGSGHWSGIMLEYNGLVQNLGNLYLPADAQYLDQKANSLSVSMNLLDYELVRGGVASLMTGLGLEFNNFKFVQNMTIVDHDGQIAPYYYDTQNVLLTKSKLTTSFINVPLIVEFKLGYYGFIDIGVIGGWRMGGHTKIKADAPTLNGTFKNSSNLHLASFHYGAVVYAGYRHIALTAKYYPCSIFKRDQGPDVQQVNIGLGFLW